MYKIHSEQNPFILPAEGGRFELPFTCKKQTYLNGQFIEETYSSLNGLRFKTISSGNVWFLTVRKDGEKIGFYKFSFVGEGPYNQKTDPECYFNIYTHENLPPSAGRIKGFCSEWILYTNVNFPLSIISGIFSTFMPLIVE